MIVLDEQLSGRGIETALAQWYAGTVCFINALRPGTLIKDEAIPDLLQQQNAPTFVTINETDFWLKAKLADDYCIVCANLSDSQAHHVNRLLRCLFRRPEFRNKTQRAGHIFRLSHNSALYYNHHAPTLVPLSNWRP